MGPIGPVNSWRGLSPILPISMTGLAAVYNGFSRIFFIILSDKAKSIYLFGIQIECKCVCVCLCMCVCLRACACVKERDRDRDRERYWVRVSLCVHLWMCVFLCVPVCAA